MERNKVIAGIAYLVNHKTVVKADDDIEEVALEAPEGIEEENAEEIAPESVEREIPDVEIPMIIEDPIVEPGDLPTYEDEDVDIDELVDEALEEAPVEEEPALEEEAHQLNDAAASFLDVAEIPKSGARVERIGSYDIIVLGPGVAINRSQLRYLLAEGLIHIAADGESGGQALVYPTGARF